MDFKDMMNIMEERSDDHKLLEVTDKENSMMGVVMDIVVFYRMEEKVLELDKKVNDIENSMRSIVD